MTTIILALATLLWVIAWIKDKAHLTRAAVLVHCSGVVIALVLRNDLPPSGWVSAALLLGLIPTLAALFMPQHPIVKSLRPLFALSAAISTAIVGAPAGPGVVIWSPWAIPHIILSIAATAAAAAGAMLALHHLAGKKVGLLSVAIVLTALPLFHPRATAVIAHQDGEPLSVSAAIVNPDGDAGVQRILPAQIQLPQERTARWIALFALLGLLGWAVVYRENSPQVSERRVHALALLILGLHMGLLASALTSRTIGDESTAKAEIVAAAEATLQLEARGGEYAANVRVANPPYTGGPGAVPIVLTLALIVMGLTVQAIRDPVDLATNGHLRTEARIVATALVLLTGALVTGMLWSNFAWGTAVVADPKLFAAAIAMGLYGLYFFCQQWLSQHQSVPSVLAALAFGVILLSMIGPEIGWTAPSLHHFGP